MEDEFEVDEKDFISERGMELKKGEESRAFLIGVYEGINGKSLCEEHLRELENLADTFGVTTVAKIACNLRKIDASTYLHEGKLQEVFEEINKLKVNLVIFDENISPAQQRNLEKFLKVPIMDRTELILEIFGQRAQTKEAQLQVELAKTKYQFPRLKRMWSHFSKQRGSGAGGGGGAHLRGMGETQLEIDKRLLKKKVEKLRDDLKAVEAYRQTQKTSRLRSGVPTFAIVGYTNAGKSTLLNALTNAHVLVEDKLFATLDPTTRKFMLPNNQEILLTDTVGFIRKLPHTLVAAFKSTLEAACQDDVLIHLIDASHPAAENQAETVLQLLKELHAKEESVITVLNKIDQCEDKNLINRFKLKYPKLVQISALHNQGFDDLMQMMMRELEKRRQLVLLRIPQNEFALVTELRRIGHILSLDYEGNDVLVKVEVPITSLHRFEGYKEKETEQKISE